MSASDHDRACLPVAFTFCPAELKQQSIHFHLRFAYLLYLYERHARQGKCAGVSGRMSRGRHVFL